MLRTLLIAALLAPPPAAAPAVTIEKLAVNGTGCRPDTVTTAVAPDGSAFTVLHSAYVALAGAETRTRDQRRTCSIAVRLTVPAGLTFAVTAVDHRGYARLDPNASATLSARHHFPGSGAPAYTVHPFAGGLDDSWQVTDAAGASPVFRGCGRDGRIDIDTELRVRADRPDAPTSLITMDSTDGAVASTYRLTYRPC